MHNLHPRATQKGTLITLAQRSNQPGIQRCLGIWRRRTSRGRPRLRTAGERAGTRGCGRGRGQAWVARVQDDEVRQQQRLMVPGLSAVVGQDAALPLVVQDQAKQSREQANEESAARHHPSHARVVQGRRVSMGGRS